MSAGRLIQDEGQPGFALLQLQSTPSGLADLIRITFFGDESVIFNVNPSQQEITAPK